MEQPRESGRSVRVLDVLLHDQDEVSARLEELGAEVRRDDIRDEAARRSALEGAGASSTSRRSWATRPARPGSRRR